jgi:hypothetical protein
VNVLWHLPDVTDVENLDLMEKLIFVQIVAIELQMLQSHLSEIIRFNYFEMNYLLKRRELLY